MEENKKHFGVEAIYFEVDLYESEISVDVGVENKR